MTPRRVFAAGRRTIERGPGLDLILAQQARRRAQVEKPRKARVPVEEAASVPAEVRRAAWARDEGRCQWRLDSGDKCGSTHRPEQDHLQPKARGGPSTVENQRGLCRRHDLLAARLAYRERWMRRYGRPSGAGEEGGADVADS